ncbi:MAG: hypothetical protein KME29_26010 [Calothrix sp. FI2-JRJ7]|nr:hypothetical protein [Calothrix sp. FI2-JRJ7]
MAAGTGAFDWGNFDISDIVAFIHLINFPVVEPQRLYHFTLMAIQMNLVETRLNPCLYRSVFVSRFL